MTRLRLLLLGAGLLAASCSRAPEALRVCADPNNLPFSNRAGQGFENRLAALIARDLGRELRYVWWAQRRGNVRETLNAGRCDLIPGVATGLEMLATSPPVYRSVYVALTRADAPPFSGFDDPRLRRARIGVQMIGDDFSNTPPAHSLARRGLVSNVRGYMVYGDYATPAPQAPIVAALARGEIDLAFVWGPTAGFYAAASPVPLRLTPLPSSDPLTGQPMAFAISVGTRKGDTALRGEVERVLQRRAPEIERLLARYHVPTVREVPPLPDEEEEEDERRG